MPLTTEQAAQLAQARRNVEYNATKLAAARAAGNAIDVTKYTDQLAREQATVARLEALESPPIPPAPVDPLDTIRQRLTALETTRVVTDEDRARRAAALDRAMLRLGEGLAIQEEAGRRQADALAKFSASAIALAEAGFSPDALSRTVAAFNLVMERAPESA